jgi:hypothetical protein
VRSKKGLIGRKRDPLRQSASKMEEDEKNHRKEEYFRCEAQFALVFFLKEA